MKKKSFTFEDFIRNFPGTDLQRLYLVLGDEPYQKNKVSQLIIDRSIKPTEKDLDFKLFYGDEIIYDQIVEECKTMPFINKYRVVLVKNFHLIKSGNKDFFSKFIDYIEKDIVLILTAETLDARQKFVKNINSQAVIINCKKPYNSLKMTGWITEEFKRNNKLIESNALNAFVNRLEPDYYSALNEIEKLCNYTKKSKISIEDVQECTTFTRENNIFELQNNLGQKNKKNTMIILNNLLSHDEPLAMIVTMLTRFFMILWKINAYQKKNISNQEISQRYLSEINPYFRKDYLSFAKNYSTKDIKKKLNYLYQADFMIKSSDIKETIIAHYLLFKLLD